MDPVSAFDRLLVIGLILALTGFGAYASWTLRQVMRPQNGPAAPRRPVREVEAEVMEPPALPPPEAAP